MANDVRGGNVDGHTALNDGRQGPGDLTGHRVRLQFSGSGLPASLRANKADRLLAVLLLEHLLERGRDGLRQLFVPLPACLTGEQTLAGRRHRRKDRREWNEESRSGSRGEVAHSRPGSPGRPLGR